MTGARLWAAIESPMIAAVMTDYWEPYKQFVPSEKHRQSKAETYTVEGYNSLFRHFLARFRRKTKCDSKSETMVAVFGHAIDGTMERRTKIYLKLTMPKKLEILDTDPEERFDRITRIASESFDVPIALVSLVDHDRQWFKSCIGLRVKETPRDMALCAHAILEDQVLIVPDAFLDPRFADNPLVTGEPHVRFYAGCPLKLPDGNRIGTLCLIDSRPRQLEARKINLLRDLGKLAELEILRGSQSD